MDRRRSSEVPPGPPFDRRKISPSPGRRIGPVNSRRWDVPRDMNLPNKPLPFKRDIRGDHIPPDYMHRRPEPPPPEWREDFAPWRRSPSPVRRRECRLGRSSEISERDAGWNNRSKWYYDSDCSFCLLLMYTSISLFDQFNYLINLYFIFCPNLFRDSRAPVRGGGRGGGGFDRGDRLRRREPLSSEHGVKRGREATGWKNDGRRSSLGAAPKRKKGDKDVVEGWLIGKTVKDIALNERILPRELVWDTDETK